MADDTGTPNPDRVLASLLSSARLVTPDDLATVVARHGERLGARAVVLYLADVNQDVLVPLTGDGVPGREPAGIDGTVAGRAFRTVDTVASEDPVGGRLWVPLLDGLERVGVMEVVGHDRSAPQAADFEAFAALVAELIVARGSYGDAFASVRRRATMSLAAEIQWNLLPPLTFGTESVRVSGFLQPCYDIGGDSFDYAMNGTRAHLALIDAMGHGLPASLMAALVLGCYRNSRRRGLGLQATLVEMDRVVGAQLGPERFATAILAELDGDTGTLRWLSAGHPSPLLVRGHKVVGPLPCEPALPVGLGEQVAGAAVAALEPGDRLVFYTDGVVEARSAQGELFGQDRLTDFVMREAAAAVPTPETLRRLSHALLDYQDGRLQDDATLLLVEWRGTDPR